MPKRKRHQPGRYKPKPEIGPNFTGRKPLTLFQAHNGLWGAKDGDGNIEIAPIYQRAEQTGSDNQQGIVRLVAHDHVIAVSPDDRDFKGYLGK